MKKKLLVVPIKRSEWITSVLCRASNESVFVGGCCIGHHGIAYGVKIIDMIGSSYPIDSNEAWHTLWFSALPKHILNKLPDWVTYGLESAAPIAAKINDDWHLNNISDVEAIDLLRPIFKFLGARIIYYKNR